ncbi:MAG: FAD:protein FMN transferase [Planctomycetaceae bacterium]
MQWAVAGWLVAGTLLGTITAEPMSERYEFRRVLMGVPFELTLYSADEASANAAAAAAFGRIKELNAILSDYDPDSELSRLCRNSGPGKPIPVSPELQRVIERGLELSAASDGAFDVSVGPAVQMWRKARRRKQLPSEQELRAALGLIGYKSIILDRKARTVELQKIGMKLDFGAIGKGYAADEAIAVLRSHGISRALVSASGDIVAADPPPGKEGWTVGIASLERPEQPPERFLSLRNAACSTAGDAFQFVEFDGKRYSHIVDPRTAMGLTRRSSVTVIAPNGITADGLDTTACLLGPERGLALVEKSPGSAAIFVELEDSSSARDAKLEHSERIKIHTTPDFQAFESKRVK